MFINVHTYHKGCSPSQSAVDEQDSGIKVIYTARKAQQAKRIAKNSMKTCVINFLAESFTVILYTNF
jgi:hypothetical protein